MPKLYFEIDVLEEYCKLTPALIKAILESETPSKYEVRELNPTIGAFVYGSAKKHEKPEVPKKIDMSNPVLQEAIKKCSVVSTLTLYSINEIIEYLEKTR